MLLWLVASEGPVWGQAGGPARTGRFTRGSGADPFFQSLLIALDFQKGIALDNVDGNATNLFGTDWGGSTIFYHYNVTNANPSGAQGGIAFNNPIAAFGRRVGGSPLYVGQRYRWGVYAGLNAFTDEGSYDIAIDVYARTNLELIQTQFIYIPNYDETDLWRQFATNGHALTSVTPGLRTTVYRAAEPAWGTLDGDCYTLVHEADSSATNYIYIVYVLGYVNGEWMVVDAGEGGSDSPLYTMEFDVRPAGRSLFLDQPQFDGAPLPPEYAGRSVAELTNLTAAITNQIWLTNNSAYRTLDQSPELRRHPVLDAFVAEQRNDPLALTRYVLNEIELTDSLAYGESGQVAAESVNLGGVNRGALGVFLEQQGSPVEQCALLIYLLRQAGYAAAYVYATNSNLKLLDSRLSKLLRMQLKGAVNELGTRYTTNSLITVNYPWVVANIDGRCVHIFPWLKDTEIVEGLNLYDYMPAEYDSGYKWVRDYIYGRTNILGLSRESDLPRILFPKFIEQALLQNHPGISLDDLGVRAFNRRVPLSRWDELPKPSALTNQSQIAVVADLASATSTFPSFNKIFDTMRVEVFRSGNSNSLLNTSDLRLCDLHNRKLLLLTNNNTLLLWLAPYRDSITNQSAFDSSDPGLLNTQVLRANLLGSDTGFTVRFTQQRHRALRTGDSFAFLDVTETQTLTVESQFKKGDLAALCFNVGRVTAPMLRRHAQDYWRIERVRQTNAAYNPSMEDNQGTAAYLMGLDYFEKEARFQDLNERLHKIHVVSRFALGLGKLTSKEVNGIAQVQPGVDMFHFEPVTAANGTMRPDSGDDPVSGAASFLALFMAESSAEEHGIINSAFQETNAISTIALLHLAQHRATANQAGIVELDHNNFLTRGNQPSAGYGSTLLKDYDPALWTDVTNALSAPQGPFVRVYMTPAPMANASASYEGMGALIHKPEGWAALISSSLHGGSGSLTKDFAPTAGNNKYVLPRSLVWGDTSVLFPENDSTEPNPFGAPWDLKALIRATGSASAPATPDQLETAQQVNTTYHLSYTAFLDTVNAVVNNAYLGLADSVKAAQAFVADPVNVMTGEFYIDATDLSLPGPMPLEIRRNYLSQNRSRNQFGLGWKMSLTPYLVVTTNGAGSAMIYAAEMDGSVIAYRQQSNDLWRPALSDNPTLNNHSTAGIGSSANMLNARIERAFSNNVETYCLKSPDGSLRRFETSSAYAVASGTNTFLRSRPYLLDWRDSRGNFYTFFYGADPDAVAFGELVRVESSSGNVVGFHYDVAGCITEAWTGDGRRLQYEYDRYGDLVTVTLPDASQLRYEYQHYSFTITNGVTVTTNLDSNHLLIRELKPDGRTLANVYDPLRRVTNQLATVGPDLNLVRNATFAYFNNFSSTNFPTNGLSGYTLVADVFNHTTRHDYTNGLLTTITDPLNQTSRQEWYLPGDTSPGAYPRSLRTSTDKRGLKTAFLYDAFGNVTQTVVTGDLTGEGIAGQSATNSFTYNSNHLPLSSIDPAGNRTQITYHTNYPYLPQMVVFSAGNTVLHTNLLDYYNMSNLVTNGTSLFTNQAFGLLRRNIRAHASPDAATNDWSHDGRGFITQSIRYTRTADPPVTNSFFYSARGELIEQADAAGRKTRLSHDALGRPTLREVFASPEDPPLPSPENSPLPSDGRGAGVRAMGEWGEGKGEGGLKPLAWEYSYYNPNGELVWSDGPRFDPEDYVWRDYDGAGRQIQEIRWRSRAKADGSGVEAPPDVPFPENSPLPSDGRGAGVGATGERGEGQDEGALYATTFMEYDGFGNLTRTIDPRGVVTANTYDAIGQLKERKVFETNGSLLAAEGFAYEPGGQVSFHTNALGGVTEKQYTSAGQLKYQKNPDGSAHAWRFRLDRRVEKEVQSNGAYWQTTYEDAMRRTTRVFYSAAGLPLATNVTELDGRGNVIRTVDAGGFPSTNVFDGLDRLKAFYGPVIPSDPPVQHTLTTYYDATGAIVTKVNALGEKTIAYTDALGRVTRTELRSADNTLLRESTTAYTANHHGMTVTNGSGASALAATSYTDNDGHNVLSVAYPAANSRQFTRHQYDQVGNLLAQTLSSATGSTVTDWTTARFAYDGLNRLRAQTERDSAVTTFDYDAAGHLTNRVMPGALQWQATYNSAGQLLQDNNRGIGGAATRANSYNYYPATHALAGLLQSRADGRGVVCAYTYDDYLRPAANTHTGPLAEHNLITSWTYDTRGLVTSLTESFAANSTGPPTGLSRTYDAYGQAQSENVTIAATAHTAALLDWNSAARRTSLGLGSFHYRYDWRADGLLAGATGDTGGGLYAYNTAGQITTRTVGSRVTRVMARDGAGRPLGLDTTINGASQLSEALAYTGDGLLATHTLTRPDFTDSRAFFYASQSRRLIEERLNLDANKRWTNTFTYDSGAVGGPGVLTKTLGALASSPAQWSGTPDTFSRVATETNTVAHRPAYGRVNGPATVTVRLDNQPMPLSVVGTQALQWRATLELTPGPHQLTASAAHPSGQFTTNASITFTNSAADTAAATYDDAGNLTQKVFKNSDGTINRTQTLVWDARGRLLKVIERDSANNGKDWSAVYDALGRRLRTTEITVTNAVSVTAQASVISHYFDPSVEFLELGVTENGRTTWKLLGPDLDGTYGGQNGTGGLDAIVPGPNQFSPTLSDTLGNLHAVYDQEQGALQWNPSRLTGYGAVPGYRPLPLGSGSNLAAESAWRNRAPDSVGLTWMGGNWYDPESAQFLSFDTLGHGAGRSIGGHNAFNGNPWAYWDADGRLAVTLPAAAAGARSTQNEIDGLLLYDQSLKYMKGAAALDAKRQSSEDANQQWLYSVMMGQGRQRAAAENRRQNLRAAAEYYKTPDPTSAQQWSQAADMLGIGQIPKALLGYDPITGSYVSDGERAASVVMTAASILPVGRAAGMGLRAADASGAFALRSAESAIGLARRMAAESRGTRLLPSYTGYQPWAGEIRSVMAASDTTMFRVWGGGSRQAGPWLSPIRPTSAASATESLALPSANTAQFYSEVLVPAGTRYQVGTAAGANGLTGGGVQVQLLEQIPNANFGPGILLPPH